MVIFADTSGLYPLLDAENIAFASTAAAWERLCDGEDGIVTTNYVLVDTATLLQCRLGIRRALALDGHFREQGFEVVP